MGRNSGDAWERRPGPPVPCRIMRLRGLRQPQYRLRVGDIRMFYDVTGTTVQIPAIVAKLEADSWLAPFGHDRRDLDGRTGHIVRSEEQTSEIQSHLNLVFLLLL